MSNCVSQSKMNMIFADSRNSHIHCSILQVSLEQLPNELNNGGWWSHHGFNDPILTKLTEMVPTAAIILFSPFPDVMTKELAIPIIKHIATAQTQGMALMCTANSVSSLGSDCTQPLGY